MACPLTASFAAYDCETVAGGLQEVYILAFADIASLTVVGGSVTVIDDSLAKWAKYELNEEVGLMEATENKDIKTNSLFYDAITSFTISKMTPAKKVEFALLATQRLIIIGKANDGTYWMIGDERGAHKAGGTNNSSTGTEFGNLNGYNMNFMAKQTHDMYEVSAAAIALLSFL